MSKTRTSTAALLGMLALTVALGSASAAAQPFLAAAPSKAKVHGIALSGRVAKLDLPGKTLVVRDGSGREVALAWTAATKITGGELKPGELVTLRYLDKDKKHIATTIHVGPVTSSTPKAAPPATTPSAPAR